LTALRLHSVSLEHGSLYAMQHLLHRCILRVAPSGLARFAYKATARGKASAPFMQALSSCMARCMHEARHTGICGKGNPGLPAFLLQ